MKKIASLIIFAVLALALSVTAFAAETIESGYCGSEDDGTNVIWNYDSDNVLTFSGTGAMKDYGEHYTQEFGYITNAPWWIYADSVELIVIEDGITYFGANALNSFGGSVVVKGKPYFGEYSLYMQEPNPSVYFLGGPPAGEHETAYNSIYYMYYVEGTEEEWGIDYGYWKGNVMYPYSPLPEVEFDPAKYIYYGYCGTDPLVIGKNIAWGIDEEGTLTIFGKGKIKDYELVEVGRTEETSAPWKKYQNEDIIKSLVIEKDITYIGTYAFYGCDKITGSLVLPKSITHIMRCAFVGCGINDYYFKGSAPDYIVPGEYYEASFDEDTDIIYYYENDESWVIKDGKWNGYTVNTWENPVVYGDINGDEKINVFDANLVRRYAAKLIDFDDAQLAAADTDGDGKVNVFDANLVRRYSAKLIDKFPVEE